MMRVPAERRVCVKVDWYEWGPEAFEKARREDKPIFLSVSLSYLGP